MKRKSLLVMALFFACTGVSCIFAEQKETSEKGKTSVSVVAIASVVPHEEEETMVTQPAYQQGEMIIQLKGEAIQLPEGSLEESAIDQVVFQDKTFKTLCQRAGIVSIQYLYPRQREKLPDSMKRTYIFRFGEGVELIGWLGQFQSDPNVEYAEPNYRVSIQSSAEP